MTDTRKGWIKLHRQIMGWDWYKDGNTVRVFLHLLLSCPAGEASCRVSVRGLGRELGLSHKECRIALAHLVDSATIAETAHTPGRDGYTEYAIVNWNKFQAKGTFNPIEHQGDTAEQGHNTPKKGTFKGTFKGAFNPIDNQGDTEEQEHNEGRILGHTSLKKNKEDTNTPARTREDNRPASALTTGFPLPLTAGKVLEVATAWGIPMTEDGAHDFFDWHQARGWRDAQGFTFHDWRFLLKRWQNNQNKNQGINNNEQRSINDNFSGTDYGEPDPIFPAL